MISETCPGSKLGRTGEAPGEVRVQKRVNKREPGDMLALRVSPRDWEPGNTGAQSLSSKSFVVRKVFHRFRSSSAPLPASASTSSSEDGPDFLIDQQHFYFSLLGPLSETLALALVITMPADFITPFTKLFGMYYTQDRPVQRLTARL